MTQQPAPIPARRAGPGDPHGLAALARLQADWEQGDAAPDRALRAWFVRDVQHRLGGEAAGPRPALPVDGAARRVHAELDHWALDVLRTLQAHGALGDGALAAVHAATALLRAQVLARTAEPTAQTLAQALAARDRQLSIATHELRTPISSILLNVQLLERTATARGTLDAATIQRLLAIPSRQLRRLTRMVDLLLDTAQVESERLELHPERVDLCEVVHDVAGRLAEMARAAGCDLALVPCEAVVGCWDRLRLEQVVHNLLTNAIKYGGGCACVSARLEQGEAVLVVRDHGGGIRPEDRATVFEPFKRLPAGAGEDGAGLGLYIVREIVRAHHGRIAIDDAPGEGATFTVRLPA